ncbi:MAG: DnaJ C-terminal domain-containing protein [bacterium]|jgi:curved DNA-binding protein|nr:DnaJ C-terminal domain-containing protein [bacterium]
MAIRYRDYYRILQIPRDATPQMVQGSFRQLARRYHPDLNRSFLAEERFKLINEAYEVLKDPVKRKQYDQLGPSWQEGQEFTPPPDATQNASHEGKERTNGRQKEKGSSGFSDFFDSLFGRGFSAFRARQEKKKRDETYGWAVRGEDIEAPLTVTLEEVYHNAVKLIEMELDPVGPSGFSLAPARRYEIKIPAGTKNGTKIRLAGQGNKGSHGGQDGDLYLVIAIQPHPRFTVMEYDLETSMQIEAWQAALGAEILVPTLGEPLSVPLPPSTASGKRLRLRGRGLLKKGNARGDLYVKIEIGFPTFHSLEERKAYEALKQISLLKNGRNSNESGI